MFIIVSLLAAGSGLWLFYHTSALRQENNQRKYGQLNLLRHLILLCREHRALTHQIWCDNNGVPTHSEKKKLGRLQQELLYSCDQLRERAHSDNRQLFRIYSRHLSHLCREWQSMGLVKNQVAHGKAIRHAMYLIDELVIAWVIEGKLNSQVRYQKAWQLALDGMDSLTQFRIAIASEDPAKLKRNSDLLIRRLSQLALMNEHPAGRPALLYIHRRLSDIHYASRTCEPESLYRLASDISTELFSQYDLVLSGICEELYQPLPNPGMSVQKKPA